MRKSIRDDDIYGPIRAEICDAYIAAGKPKPERNWLYSRLVGVTLKIRSWRCCLICRFRPLPFEILSSLLGLNRTRTGISTTGDGLCLYRRWKRAIRAPQCAGGPLVSLSTFMDRRSEPTACALGAHVTAGGDASANVDSGSAQAETHRKPVLRIFPPQPDSDELRSAQKHLFFSRLLSWFRSFRNQAVEVVSVIRVFGQLSAARVVTTTRPRPLLRQY